MVSDCEDMVSHYEEELNDRKDETSCDSYERTVCLQPDGRVLVEWGPSRDMEFTPREMVRLLDWWERHRDEAVKKYRDHK